MKRHTLTAAVLATLVVTTVPAVAMAASQQSAPKTQSAAVKTLDLRYSMDGSFVNYDYADDGKLEVYKHGGLGATQDSPILASVKVTTSRHGRTGTVTLRITSQRRVEFSPMNFTWLAPGIATGPTTWKDVSVPAGTHTRTLKFEDVAKGTVDWNLQPTTNFDWSTR